MKRHTTSQPIKNPSNAEEDINDILRKYYKARKLFHSRELDPPNSEFFTNIQQNPGNHKRVFVFTSKAYIGLEFLEEDLKINKNILIEQVSEARREYDLHDGKYITMIDDFLNHFPNFSEHVNSSPRVIFVKNLPVEVYSEEIKYKEIKNLEEVKQSLLNFLNRKEKTRIIYIFYWDDGTGTGLQQKFGKVFGENILKHQNLSFINCTRTRKKDFEDLLLKIIEKLKLNLSPSVIDSLEESFDGNLNKMKDWMIQKWFQQADKSNGKKSKSNFNQSQESNTNNTLSQVVPSSVNRQGPSYNQLIRAAQNVRPHEEDVYRPVPIQTVKKEDPIFSFYHIIGKILYNKRIDGRTGEIRPMKKAEMTAFPRPKLYFNIPDLINTMPFEQNTFNEFLIENSYDHFNDVGELARAFETFSFTDQLNKYSYTEKNNYEIVSLNTMRSQLNAMACTNFNLSQYEPGAKKKQGGKLTKPIYYQYNKSIITDRVKEIYYTAVKKNPSLLRIGMKNFLYQITPILQIIANYKGKKTIAHEFNQMFKVQKLGEEEISGEVQRVNNLAEEDRLMEIQNYQNKQEGNQFYTNNKKKIFDNKYESDEEEEKQVLPVITLDNLEDYVHLIMEAEKKPNPKEKDDDWEDEDAIFYYTSDEENNNNNI